MKQQSRGHRAATTLISALCLLLVSGLVAGCFADPDEEKNRQERRDAEASAKAQGWVQPTTAPLGTFPSVDPFVPLYYEESPSPATGGAGPLVGTWNYYCPAFTIIKPGKTGKWIPDPTGACHLTIEQQENDYVITNAGKDQSQAITLDGDSVTITTGGEIEVVYTGTLSGDTIIGQMTMIRWGAKYAGAWEATRVR